MKPALNFFPFPSGIHFVSSRTKIPLPIPFNNAEFQTHPRLNMEI